MLRVPSSRPETAANSGGPARADHADQRELRGAGEHQQRERARLPHAEPARDRDRAEGDPVGTGGHADGDAVPDDRARGGLVGRHQRGVDQGRVQPHLLDGGGAVPEEVERAVRAVGAPAGARSGTPRRSSSSAGSQVTAWVNRSATRVSAPAWSSREPWPAPRLCGSTVRSVSSPVATGSQSGSLGGPGHDEAGDQVALEGDEHPVAGVVGAAERVAPGRRRCRRGRATRGPRRAAGRRTIVRQARTWTAAIAGASSAHATRAETSALVMGPIQPSGRWPRLLEVLETSVGAAQHQRAGRADERARPPRPATTRPAPRRRRRATPDRPPGPASPAGSPARWRP